jgi:hypothetical protein
MQATVEGNELVVRIPLQKPAPSSTGRTLIVANSGGPKATEAEVNGKKITVNLSAWIKP